MRRQAELRTVSGEEKGRTALKSVKSGTVETMPATTMERRIFSTISDMERMMEEAFHRPFFRAGTLPLRHLFHELGSFGEFAPVVDIFEEKGEVVVKAELPGIKKDDISVKVVGNEIIINGEKKTEEKVERKDNLRENGRMDRLTGHWASLKVATPSTPRRASRMESWKCASGEPAQKGRRGRSP